MKTEYRPRISLKYGHLVVDALERYLNNSEITLNDKEREVLAKIIKQCSTETAFFEFLQRNTPVQQLQDDLVEPPSTITSNELSKEEQEAFDAYLKKIGVELPAD